MSIFEEDKSYDISDQFEEYIDDLSMMSKDHQYIIVNAIKNMISQKLLFHELPFTFKYNPIVLDNTYLHIVEKLGIQGTIIASNKYELKYNHKNRSIDLLYPEFKD